MTVIINESLLNKRFKKRSLIGAGGHGVASLAFDYRLQQEVAIKSEAANSSQLSHEKRVYQALKHSKGFSMMHNYFREGNKNYLAMTLLGPSIESQFSKCNYKMELKTVLTIADQLIDHIKILHGLDYIHRDIKPDNMAMGTGNLSNKLHLLDFGLAKVFKENRIHLRQLYRGEMVGTAEYASLNSHNGFELSRRDDLESMAYTFIYLRKGSLPWQNLRENILYDEKRNISPEDLCQGIEPEFLEFLTYARGLNYTEKPDYDMVKKMFNDLFRRKGYNKPELDDKGKNTTENIVEKKRQQKRKMKEEKMEEMPYIRRERLIHRH